MAVARRGARKGPPGLMYVVDERRHQGATADRLLGLPRREVRGTSFPVATTRSARLLGLALLDRDDAGPGLLIPSCRSVHTFGMRFAIDVWFLAESGEPVSVRRRVGRRRIVADRRASLVLEVPA